MEVEVTDGRIGEKRLSDYGKGIIDEFGVVEPDYRSAVIRVGLRVRIVEIGRQVK